MAAIQNHKFTPLTVFRDGFYEIPDYQREYVWTEREVGKLLEDITDQFRSNSPSEYFIGTILVSGMEGYKDHFEVIDGQQRLTTIFLIIAAIKHRFGSAVHKTQAANLLFTDDVDKNGEVKTVMRLIPRYEGAVDVFERLVTTPPGDPSLHTSLSAAGIAIYGSVEKLIDAYQYIDTVLGESFPDDAQLKPFWGFFANQLTFIQISTDVSMALKIFETINERGVGLNPMDLLKNLLFRSVPQSDFGRLKVAWEKVTKPLEAADEKPLRFLRYFLMANYPANTADGPLREDQIYDWLTDKKNAALCNYAGKPFEFVRKIALNVERYLRFRNDRDTANMDSPELARLHAMTGGAFRLHLPLLLAAAELPSNLFKHLVSQTESYLFFLVYTKAPTKELELAISAWCANLRMIGTITDATEQIAALDDFVEKHYAVDMQKRRPEMIDALRRYSEYSMQNYRTKFFLARITQFVDDGFAGGENPILTSVMRLEIEHILPQTPKPELLSTWADANPDVPYDDFVHKLGNLTLLEKPHNIVASNGFYADKVKLYKQSGNYLTRSLAGLEMVGANSSVNRINAKLRAYTEWTSASIEARQLLLVDLALDIWKSRKFDGTDFA